MDEFTQQPAEPTSDQVAQAPEADNPLFQGGMYLGKYATPEAAVQGHWQLNNYAATLAEQNKALQAQLSVNQAAASPPDDPVSQLAREALLPQDTFVQAVSRIAEQMVAKRFEPIERAYAAREAITQRLPEYESNLKTVDAWLMTQPETYQDVKALQDAGLYKQAGVLAYREWQAAQGATRAPNPQARAAAGMPNTQAQASRSGGSAPSQSNMTDAVAYARAYGDVRPAYSEIFKGFEFFGSPGES
jgi:hypothetical protein